MGRTEVILQTHRIRPLLNWQADGVSPDIRLHAITFAKPSLDTTIGFFAMRAGGQVVRWRFLPRPCEPGLSISVSLAMSRERERGRFLWSRHRSLLLSEY